MKNCLIILLVCTLAATFSGMIFPEQNTLGGAADIPIRKIASGKIIHRFHDTSPISPSGKYIALFRIPFEDHYPEAGDAGEVVLINIATGKETIVERSFGWEMQVGANVQW